MSPLPNFLLSKVISLCLVLAALLSLIVDDCQSVLRKHTAAARPNSWGGSSFPHMQRLAPGLPSPPWPQLCERNAKGACVLQPRANIHGGTRGSGEMFLLIRGGWSWRRGVKVKPGPWRREEPEVRSQTAVPTLVPSETWAQFLLLLGP